MYPTTRNKSRQLYDCEIEGEASPIVTGSWDPDHDVCRILVARGKTEETVEFWHANATYAGLRVFDVRRWAALSTRDGAKKAMGVIPCHEPDRD